MDNFDKTIEEIRKFNRFYTVNMGFLDLNYLDSNYSSVEMRILFEIKTLKFCTQSDILKILRIDKSYLSRIIRRLCAKGLIEKTQSNDDKRATKIALTEKGIAETERLIDLTNGQIKKQIDGLSSGERQQLNNALKTVTAILGKDKTEIEIIPFEEKYRQDFIDFNTDWIITNFGFLEEHDKETFEKIDDELKAGAMIFFAVKNGTALATCMATPMEGGTWEICKLGSNKNMPHKGAGSAVFEAAMQWALDHGAERLFILSNSKLKPALHIYKKFGFKEIKLNDYEYARGDIAFEYRKSKTH